MCLGVGEGWKDLSMSQGVKGKGAGEGEREKGEGEGSVGRERYLNGENNRSCINLIAVG